MKKLAMLLLAAGAVAASPVLSAPVPGQPAPAFAGVDVEGKPVRLSDFRGRTVVLEWSNPNCPFVQKHYTSGNMQSLQHRNTGAGVVWLAINSTSEAHPDYRAPAKLAAWFVEQKAGPSAIVMDPKGEIGRSYGAKVTPHMFVIGPDGTLAYAGAIDDKRSANPADVRTAANHVAAALAELGAGKPVTTPATLAYGCTIKYEG